MTCSFAVVLFFFFFLFLFLFFFFFFRRNTHSVTVFLPSLCPMPVIVPKKYVLAWTSIPLRFNYIEMNSKARRLSRP